MLVGLDVHGHFYLNRLSQQLLGTLPQNPGQHILDRSYWKPNGVCRTLVHGVSSVNG